MIRPVDKRSAERGGRATETGRDPAETDPVLAARQRMDIVIIVLAALRLITGRRARS